ncbi:uncharacterized protein LOC120653599 [Panicum virgatum]|uniref:uncharacterized protein LOC120653599 n=1 Tax=Panicum virgatum TaxID=38727 RepID=UPI0019D65A72|nr:uncharacterized protein LOC120653599 [Panicum virgatum]
MFSHLKMSTAEVPNSKDPEIVDSLLLDLLDPENKAYALSMLPKKRETLNNLAPLLWYSFGTIAALLQEIVSVYPALSPPTLSASAGNRACNALALLQTVAAHPETRTPFLKAEIPLYLFPILNTTSEAKSFEYLRVTGLGILGALAKCWCICEPMNRGSCIGSIYPILLGFGGIHLIVFSYMVSEPSSLSPAAGSLCAAAAATMAGWPPPPPAFSSFPPLPASGSDAVAGFSSFPGGRSPVPAWIQGVATSSALGAADSSARPPAAGATAAAAHTAGAAGTATAAAPAAPAGVRVAGAGTAVRAAGFGLPTSAIPV